jgi:hypothetical protein
VQIVLRAIDGKIDVDVSEGNESHDSQLRGTPTRAPVIHLSSVRICRWSCDVCLTRQPQIAPRKQAENLNAIAVRSARICRRWSVDTRVFFEGAIW